MVVMERGILYNVGRNINLHSFYGTWEIFFNKLKIELPYNAGIPFLDTYLKNSKLTYHRYTCTLVFTPAPFTGTSSKTLNQPRCP